jgi:hypothetical protein
MTRFIFAGILLLSLYSCDDKDVETYRHEIPHGHHLLQGDVESYNQLILPPVECAVEFTGDRNETVEVSYFYMEKHKDTLFWEEGHIKVPIRQVNME